MREFDLASAIFRPTMNNQPKGKAGSEATKVKHSKPAAQKDKVKDQPKNSTPPPVSEPQHENNNPKTPMGNPGEGTSGANCDSTMMFMTMFQNIMEEQRNFQKELLAQNMHDDADNADYQPPSKKHKSGLDFVDEEISDGEYVENDTVEQQLTDLIGDNVADTNSHDLLGDLAKEYQVEEETGPKLEPKLADLMTSLIANKLPEDKLKSKLEAYPRPENCDNFQAPRVNPELWGKLKTFSRSRDIKVQRVQNKMVKGLVPLAQLIETLLAARKDPAKLDCASAIRLAMDTATLITSASQDLSQQRREFIKPDLNAQFAQLASPHNPVGKIYLFGDDLQQTVKTINETNRVSQNVSSGFQQPRHATQSTSRPFLGQNRFNQRPRPNFQNRRGFGKSRGGAQYPKQYHSQKRRKDGDKQ